MPVFGFKSLSTKDKVLDRVQNNIEIFSDSVIKNPLLDGMLLEDIALTTTETQVNHKLGRVPNGWIIVKKNAAQDVYESGSTLTDRFLSLTAAGTVTVSLWVF